MRHFLFAFAAAGILLFAGRAAADPATQPAATQPAVDGITKSIQGLWELSNDEIANGSNWHVASMRGPPVEWLIGADFIRVDGKRTVPYRLDASKQPATIDFTGLHAPDQVNLGIFKLDGEKLVICVAKNGARDRPRDFSPAAPLARRYEFTRTMQEWKSWALSDTPAAFRWPIGFFAADERLLRGWITTRADGTLEEHLGFGESNSDGWPVAIEARLRDAGEFIELQDRREWAGNSKAIDTKWQSTKPTAEQFRLRAVNTGRSVSLHPDRYTLLLEGQWLRNGQVVKTVRFGARARKKDEKAVPADEAAALLAALPVANADDQIPAKSPPAAAPATQAAATPPQMELSLTGTITAPDGKPGKKYVVFVEPEEFRYRFGELPHTQTDDFGRYAFTGLPAGLCSVWANPFGAGQPMLRVDGIKLEANQKFRLDLSLRTQFQISGRATDQSGQPVPGREVMSTWVSKDGQWKFDNFATTDAQGRYTIGSPLPTASYVGLSRTGSQPRPHRNIEAGREDVDFIVGPPKASGAVAPPTTQPATRAAADPATQPAAIRFEELTPDAIGKTIRVFTINTGFDAGYGGIGAKPPGGFMNPDGFHAMVHGRTVITPGVLKELRENGLVLGSIPSVKWVEIAREHIRRIEFVPAN